MSHSEVTRDVLCESRNHVTRESHVSLVRVCEQAHTRSQDIDVDVDRDNGCCSDVFRWSPIGSSLRNVCRVRDCSFSTQELLEVLADALIAGTEFER